MVTRMKELLRPLRGEFYNNYMRPSEKELAAAMKKLLEEALESLPDSRAIVIKRCAYQAMKEYEPDFWTKIFVGAKIIDVLASDGSKDAALLIKTTSCDRVIVTASHFMPFAEETTLSIAASTFKSFFALAKIRHKAGRMSDGHLRYMQQIFGHVLVEMDGSRRHP